MKYLSTVDSHHAEQTNIIKIDTEQVARDPILSSPVATHEPIRRTK